MLRADKGLFKHWIFWLCVLGPIFLSLGLAYWFGLFFLPFSPTLQGVENFYERGRFFLALAALAIPFGATFARMHASEQTAEVIKHNLYVKGDGQNKQMFDSFSNNTKAYDGKKISPELDCLFNSEYILYPIPTYSYFLGSSSAIASKKK